MKCMDPILCYTPGTKPGRQFRHFSLANELFKQLPHQVFNCGKCIFCRKKRSTELAMKCVLHASLYEENCFLTLTYDEKRQGYHNEFNYKDIQDFKKRLRTQVWRTQARRIEVFNVHEYGKNGKKHWHLIVFNFQPGQLVLHSMSGGLPLYTSVELQKIWPHGFHTIGNVSEGSAMYQAQYTQKDLRNGNALNEKKSHSKHSGIGKPYFLKNYSQILRNGFVSFSGGKRPIPRSFIRIAHKHYCHFYEKSAFFDTNVRKALYRPFKQGVENQEIADLYKTFIDTKKEYIKQLETEWEETLSQHLETGDKPDFVKSGENAAHDLFNRTQLKDF